MPERRTAVLRVAVVLKLFVHHLRPALSRRVYPDPRARVLATLRCRPKWYRAPAR